jgi:sec-independent protein translocase protein TatB
VFENLNGGELVVLVVLAMFIFGPEQLPKMISDAARMMRNVRTMARNATADLRNELGTDIELEDLNPKTFVRKHLLSEDDEEAIFRQPFRDAYEDIRQVGQTSWSDTGLAEQPVAGSTPDLTKNLGSRPDGRTPEPRTTPRFDPDAT